MRERGMYWGDLIKLIKLNEASNAYISFYRDERVNPRAISIFDRNILHRKPELLAETGDHKYDFWRDSLIGQAAYFGGEIPMESSRGDELGSEVYRGALGVLTILLTQGCLKGSDELRQFFARHGRPLPTYTPPRMAIDLSDYSHAQEASPTS